MASKIKLGIFGAYRGVSSIECCNYLEDVEIVAICDKSEYALNSYRKNSCGANIAFYNDYDEFVPKGSFPLRQKFQSLLLVTIFVCLACHNKTP